MSSTAPEKPKRSAEKRLTFDNASQLVRRVDELSSRFETAAEASAAGDRLLHERISTVENNLYEKIESEGKNIAKHIDKLGDRFETKMSALDKRVSVLERWRWFIVGGAGVALFALSNYFLRLMLTAPR